MTDDFGRMATEMSEVWSELGPDEKRTLLYLAKRLHMGQKQYGFIKLAEDKRDWSKEMLAEAADFAIYGAFKALSG